ncbi:MAG: hypothetical protein WBK51_17210 [Polaromonas sp.]
MNRYKWYRLGLPISFQQLLKNIAKNKFVSDANFGFMTTDADWGKRNFRFAWRTHIAKTSFDNAGTPSVELVASVSYCDFHLFERNELCWLRVVNPPRSLKELLNAIEQLSGFGFFSDPVFFPTALPPSLAQNKDAKLIGFKAIGSIPKQHAVTRVEIASKEGLQIDKLDFLSQMKCVIDHSVYEITFQRIRGQVAFSSTGVLKISGQLAPLLLSLIEADLITAK